MQKLILPFCIFITKNNMQNFGKIKHTFNNLLAESLTNNDSVSKLLFKEYVKAVLVLASIGSP